SAERGSSTSVPFTAAHTSGTRYRCAVSAATACSVRHDGAVRLRKLGHSCLFVSTGDARILIDPGTFSPGFEEVDGLTAVLVTHQHPDHVDVARLPRLLERNPDAQLVTDVATAQMLRDDHGIEASVASGGTYDV